MAKTIANNAMQVLLLNTPTGGTAGGYGTIPYLGGQIYVYANSAVALQQVKPGMGLLGNCSGNTVALLGQLTNASGGGGCPVLLVYRPGFNTWRVVTLPAGGARPYQCAAQAYQAALTLLVSHMGYGLLVARLGLARAGVRAATGGLYRVTLCANLPAAVAFFATNTRTRSACLQHLAKALQLG